MTETLSEHPARSKTLRTGPPGNAWLGRLALVLAVLLAGCAEPVSEMKREYVGDWRSSEMTLRIGADGTVAYERFKKGGNVTLNAPIKEFRGDDFVVGVLFLTTTFEVSEPPHRVAGRWQMVVDGVRLTRVDSPGSGPLRRAALPAAGSHPS